ncbi:MAG: adenylyl-sulfate kinase [Bdellovibrionales bacterium]|nr:adenylyl-sulfate kinase [Bdellovibrionales bacterium]
MIVWLIGLSGSGKTEVARSLREKIVALSKNCVFLDGDTIRELLGNDLGHTLDDRRRNAYRISRLCRYLDQQGINVVFGVLSLFPENRSWNREHIVNYYEVFLDAPLPLLVERDSKDLYRKALSGKLKNVVGVDLAFPPPESSDLTLVNDFTRSVGELAEIVLEKVKGRLH